MDAKEKINIWDRIRRFFVPTYTEVGLFLMALSFLLLAVFDADIKKGIINIIKKAIDFHGKESEWAIMVTVFFISGFILSIYNAFSSRPKSEIEKTIMLVFALGINGAAGAIASIRIFNDYHGLLIIFPALNILSSIILLYLIGFADPTIIDDVNASPSELIVGSIIAVSIFYLCKFRFDLHWSATFSICVAYAMSVHDILGGLFLRKSTYKRTPINRAT